MIGRLLGRIRSVRAKTGIVGLVRFVAGHLFARRWRSYLYALASPVRVPWPKTESFVIYTAVGPPIPKATSDLIRRYERGLVESIHRDCWLYVVYVNGECQHFGRVGFSSRQVRILGELPQTVLIGPCVTIPQARGRGLYRRALAELGALLRAAGHKRIILETAPENYASQRGIEAAGYKLQRIMDIWIFFNALAVATIRINDSVSRKIWCTLSFGQGTPLGVSKPS